MNSGVTVAKASTTAWDPRDQPQRHTGGQGERELTMTGGHTAPGPGHRTFHTVPTSHSAGRMAFGGSHHNDTQQVTRGLDSDGQSWLPAPLPRARPGSCTLRARRQRPSELPQAPHGKDEVLLPGAPAPPQGCPGTSWPPETRLTRCWGLRTRIQLTLKSPLAALRSQLPGHPPGPRASLGSRHGDAGPGTYVSAERR